MKKNLLFISLFLSLVLISSTLASAALYRTLRQGSTGADVRELQIMLNKDPETRIAVSGVGSPGRESTSFGTLTRKAVLKFQAKYAEEVLYSAGISFPTGIVGVLTRSKLNKLYAVLVPQSNTNGGTQGGGTVINSVAPHLDAINPVVVTSSPQTITLSGSGFTASGNTIVIASDNEKGIGQYNSADGKTLTFSYTSSLVEKIKSQLARYKGTAQYQSVLSAFVQNLTGETVFVEGGTTYVRAIILVKNSGGISNAVTLKVDIKSLLQQ